MSKGTVEEYRALMESLEKQASSKQEVPVSNPTDLTGNVFIRTESVEDEILRSISKNINTMADDINKNEKEKQEARKEYMDFFRKMLVFLLFLVTALIIADTFFHVPVRIEFLVSVILAILADVFAIVHTFVKYMTSMEHYEAYHKMIDSLLHSILNPKN